MDESDIIDLLDLQRLTAELLDHLLIMFSQQEAADLLRALAEFVRRQRQPVARHGLGFGVPSRAERCLAPRPEGAATSSSSRRLVAP